MSAGLFQEVFQIRDAYALGATLHSGQAFRWLEVGAGWEAVLAGRWVRLREAGEDRTRLVAETVVDPGDWGWLRRYLALDDDLAAILATFPADAAVRTAVAACRGLRVLRQDPWECLASFILSSTKQIVQIRQIVGLLCERYGEEVPVLPGRPRAYAFPTAEVLAAAGEGALRECRMGFRARYLAAAAAAVAGGRLLLPELSQLPLAEARERLMELPGVGRKIAGCVLLFSCGFPAAFPVDVWVLRVLREAYFPRRCPRPARLLQFAETHFGPYGGHAQQYLFHHIRSRAGRVASAGAIGAGSVRDGA